MGSISLKSRQNEYEKWFDVAHFYLWATNWRKNGQMCFIRMKWKYNPFSFFAFIGFNMQIYSIYAL